VAIQAVSASVMRSLVCPSFLLTQGRASMRRADTLGKIGRTFLTEQEMEHCE